MTDSRAPVLGHDTLPICKADRHVILQGLSKLTFGYAREVAERIEATKCPACGGNGYAPYVGGDDDDLACLECDGTGFRDDASMPRSDQYGQRDRSPDLKPGDLQRGLHMLQEAADRGETWARALLAEIERLDRDREFIRRGAISVGGEFYWTGRNWKERG